MLLHPTLTFPPSFFPCPPLQSIVSRMLLHPNLLTFPPHISPLQSNVSRMLLHPNIVVTYDCCTGVMDAKRLAKISTAAGPAGSRGGGGKARQRNMTVMVQEYCDGGTLKDALTKQRFGLDP